MCVWVWEVLWGGGSVGAHARVYVCMCVCMCARVCVRVCASAFLDKEGSRVFVSTAPAVAERSCILPIIVII